MDSDVNQEVINSLTTSEIKAINSLKRIAKNWPKSLWLYATGSSLCIMKKDTENNKVLLGEGRGFDQRYSVATIDIDCDGGDW